MNRLNGERIQPFEHRTDLLQRIKGDGGVGFHLFGGEKLKVVVRQHIDKVELGGDIAKHLTARMQCFCEDRKIDILPRDCPADPGVATDKNSSGDILRIYSALTKLSFIGSKMAGDLEISSIAKTSFISSRVMISAPPRGLHPSRAI